MCCLLVDGMLQELNWFRQSYSSWFLGDYISEGAAFALVFHYCFVHYLNFFGNSTQVVGYTLPLKLILFSSCCPFLKKLE